MPSYVAIGDIHGMFHALDALLALLPAEGELVFLGDYVDRGPAVKAVIDRLLRLREERPCRFLRGNHEAMLLAALDGDREMEANWLANGGLQTLESYGGRPPCDHEAFLRETLPYYETDAFIFVHAGLLPGLRPDEVGADTYLWVRSAFLHSEYDWGKRIIHGHTPLVTGQPDLHPNRINIDTGAVYGKALSAILLPECEFLSVPTGTHTVHY